MGKPVNPGPVEPSSQNKGAGLDRRRRLDSVPRGTIVCRRQLGAVHGIRQSHGAVEQEGGVCLTWQRLDQGEQGTREVGRNSHSPGKNQD